MNKIKELYYSMMRSYYVWLSQKHALKSWDYRLIASKYEKKYNNIKEQAKK